ncbi:hypothetical protein D3C87_1328980 [compost metagenome]
MTGRCADIGRDYNPRHERQNLQCAGACSGPCRPRRRCPRCPERSPPSRRRTRHAHPVRHGRRRAGRGQRPGPPAVRGLAARRRPLYPRLPRQDLRNRLQRRDGQGRRAQRARQRRGAAARHGHADRAGLRLPPAGGRAAGIAPCGIPVRGRRAHYGQRRARMRQGGRRRTAAGHRGRLQPGPAEHADGRRAAVGGLRQLHHRAAGGYRQWRRLPAHRAGAQDRLRLDAHVALARQGSTAVAAGLLAHRAGVQPVDGRRGQRHRQRAEGRQADLHHRSARRAGPGGQADEGDVAAHGRGAVAEQPPAAGRGLLPRTSGQGAQGRRAARAPDPLFA